MWDRNLLVIVLWCVSFSLFGQQGITTVVIEKPVSTAKRAWSVYSDAAMENVVGSVNPGDSIRVFSWKPWTFKIESKSTAGYISWRAVAVTPALSKMARELESKSDSLIRAKDMADSLKPYEALKYWHPVVTGDPLSESWKTIADKTLPSDQSAFLRLSTADTVLEVGECTVVTFSFYVNELNKVPMKFHELPKQINDINRGVLNQPGTWSADGKIENIISTSVKINGASFDEYRLITSAYCPVEAKPIEFKPISLTLMKYALGEDSRTSVETPIIFTTQPLKINVRPANNTGATAADFFRLTGKFVLTDSVHRQEPGSPIVYTVTLKGKGYSFPIRPPLPESKNITAKLISVQDADTILGGTFYSSKSFTWELYLKEGEHKIWSKPLFSAYDPETKSITHVGLNRVITVQPGKGNYVYPIPPAAPDHFILVDVSQSMMIEDYTPNRLGVVKNGLYDFLTKRLTCDIGLITFSGIPERMTIADKNTCYSATKLKEIGFNKIALGTAIGDALWLAVHSINPATIAKKIILIGDGESTAGYTNIERAIELSRKYKVVVHTISIGKSGMVPFGRDPEGNPLMIPSNFSGATLKQIAEKTGGKYFHAQSQADVTKFLQQVLSK